MNGRELVNRLPTPLAIIVAGAAIGVTACVLCCGGAVYLFRDQTAVQRRESYALPNRVEDLPFDLVGSQEELRRSAADAELAFLETLPATRTGLTREQAKLMLAQCDGKTWKKLRPEGQLAICRLAAKRLRPDESEEEQHMWARSYFKLIEENVYANKLESAPIKDLISLLETIERAAASGDKKADR